MQPPWGAPRPTASEPFGISPDPAAPDYGVEPADVRDLTATPGVTDAQIVAFIHGRAGELDLLLGAKGVVVPVDGPPRLIDTLRLAITYGAASMLEGAPVITNPYNSAQQINLYLNEYQRILTELAALTPQQLIALGVTLNATTLPALPVAVNAGLGLAGNRRVEGPYGDWTDRWPVIKRGAP